MSRSVQQPYPPKGATMPRYSEALNDVLAHVTPPLPGVTSGNLTYRAPGTLNLTEHGDWCKGIHDNLAAQAQGSVRAAEESAGTPRVDVEVIIHQTGKPLPVVRYTAVSEAVVAEAMAHINDNADGVGVVSSEASPGTWDGLVYTCACDGCWACAGKVAECTCDVDWEKVYNGDK